MLVRTVLALIGIAGVLAVPVASGSSPVVSATGGVHWTIPLPNQFGVEVVNQPLVFTAQKYADGSVSGEFTYHQIVEGESFNFHVDVTCMNVYDGNRAKIGGVITYSNDPTLPAGVFAWFQVFDNGEGVAPRQIARASSASGTRLPTRPSATARTSHASAPGTWRGTFRCGPRDSLQRRGGADGPAAPPPMTGIRSACPRLAGARRL